MIDTIVLALTKDMYHISDADKFKPSARWAENSSRIIHGMQSRQNPTKKEMRRGIYKPRLTLYPAFVTRATADMQVILKIELSLPKLFFGNNFDELLYKDFSLVVKKLEEILKEMGVVVSADTLSQASVSAIHYSKNIPLVDGSTPYHFINKIKEANIKLSLDVNQTDYRNDGHSYRWHCNAYEVVFYDKIRDLEKAKQSSKRALEKDPPSLLELRRTGSFKKRKKLEVLRMEVRLNKRQKIKQLFKTLNIKADLTFKKLFKPAISKKVLLHYLDELESKRPALLDFDITKDKTLLVDLIFNNPNLGPKQILQMFGLKKILETVTFRELRTMFSNYNERSWYRLMSDVNKIRLPMAQPTFGVVRKHLMKFRPLRLKKYI